MTSPPGSSCLEREQLRIGRCLDELTVNRTHRRVTWTIGIGLFFDIYEIFLAGAIGTALKTQFGLGGNELMLLLASSFLGMAFGSALLAPLADVLGRKQAFMFNLSWFSAWSLIAAFSPNPSFLVVARFLAGIGVGAEYPVADAYLSDVLPKAHRGRLAAWAYTCSFIAVPAGGFLALALTGHQVLGIDGWRILLAIGGIGAATVAMVRRNLPESPRWLAGVGRVSDARRALEQFVGATGETVGYRRDDPGSPTRVQAHIPARPTTTRSPARLFRLPPPPYRGRFGMMVVFHFFQAFGYYGFGTLATLVLVARGYDVTSSLLYSALSFIGYPVGAAAAIPLLKSFERKHLLIGSGAVMAGCGLMFAAVDNVTLIVVCGFLTTATSNVFSSIYHVYQAEIFPTGIRATAVGATYSVSRISSGALPFTLLPVLYHFGAVAMFTVVMVALAIALSAIALVGPRTHATGRRRARLRLAQRG